MPTQTESDVAAADVVQRAFRLGWRFAQLYHSPHRATSDDPPDTATPPVHLPSLSELSEGNRTELILQQTIRDAGHLLPQWSSGEGGAELLALQSVMEGAQDSSAKKTTVLSAYRRLRIEAGAQDARLGQAIDLGRMLADTVIQANAGDSPDTYVAQFDPYRLQNAYEWLEDLHESFPKHASDAVRGSLQCWQQWVSSSARSGEDSRVKRALSLQGERWRRILSGEILADDLLGSDDYRQAISNYLDRTAKQAWAFVRHYWWAVIIVLGGTTGIIVAILNYAPSGPASVAAVIATAVGSLGLSWKTVGATLGKVAALAERPLWNAEVLEAITLATFIPPTPMNTRAKASLRRKSVEPMALAARPDAQPQLQQPPSATSMPASGEA